MKIKIMLKLLFLLIAGACVGYQAHGLQDSASQKLLEQNQEIERQNRIRDFFALLSDSDVISELELAGDQNGKVIHSLDQRRVKRHELSESGDTRQRMQHLVEIDLQVFDDVLQTLLPHQLERLDQLYRRRKARTFGGRHSQYLLRNPIPLFELTVEQRREIAEIEEKNQAQLIDLSSEFYQVFSETRETEKQQVIALLDKQQLDKLSTLIGDEHDGPGLDRAVLITLRQYLRQLKNEKSEMPTLKASDESPAKKANFVLFNIYAAEGVVDYLEPTDDQLELIAKAIEQMDDRRDHLLNFPGSLEDKRHLYKQAEIDAVKEINAGLLPHQLERVEQLYVRRLLNTSEGSFSRYLSSVLKDHLGVSDFQAEKMKEIYESSSKLIWRHAEEYEGALGQVFEADKAEVMGTLDSAQRELLENALGDSFHGERWAAGNALDSTMSRFVLDYRPDMLEEERRERFEGRGTNQSSERNR